LKAKSLDSSIIGLPTFDLSELKIESELEFELPTNLRLGHLAETVVSGLIKASTNYNVLYENVQMLKGKKTIGELDFIIENESSKELIHLELAYKFYLYDPGISSETINNWIGPNRNDSLTKKLEKVKSKQFPLLKNESSTSIFDNIDLGKVSQALCLLASLYIPSESKEIFSPAYDKAIQGYYLNIEKFMSLNHSEKSYYLPSKTAWGIEPSENKTWTSLNDIEQQLKRSMKDKRAQLCWQKSKDSYTSFFIVWW